MTRTITRVMFIVGSFAVSMPAHAQAPLYSFENGTQGFGPNGTPLMVLIDQDTFGATEGTKSLLFGISSQEVFGGALTHVVDQAALLDPATAAIALDITGEYSGAFANMGIT